VGPHFPTVFEEVLGIATEDDKERLHLQQLLIDAIDEAEYIHLKGKAPNRTDIRFRLKPISDTSSYTNFTNCGKGQNIPAGEVFTTPLLNDTSGLLHLDRFLFEGHTFLDLTLHIADGYIDSYDCANFENAEDNAQFLINHLFAGHTTLPIGEFAIGTNTRAYSVVRQYDLTATAPSVLMEKTAPHLAIGDSCYARRTEILKNHMNGKKLNILNNQDRLFNTHVDITIPFEQIESLVAVFSDGKNEPIISEGLFALSDLAIFNIPLQGQ
jgi:leucyl aminopeptidase (aminopeptidase T)